MSKHYEFAPILSKYDETLSDTRIYYVEIYVD
jgi:hypothetical protein